MITSITQGVSQAIGIGGDVVNAIFGAEGALAEVSPVIFLIIGVGLVGWGVKLVKSLVWGF